MTYEPGTYFVVRTGGFAGWLIRIGTQSWANHAGVIVSTEGATVEAKPSGARLGNVNDYKGDRLVIGSPLDIDDPRRPEVATAARSLLLTPYNWLDILALALVRIHVRLGFIVRRVARYDRLICSELVDRAFELAGVHLFTDGRLPQDVTPADLAGLLIGKGSL